VAQAIDLADLTEIVWQRALQTVLSIELNNKVMLMTLFVLRAIGTQTISDTVR